MARIRTIKPEFWSSPGIENVTPWARLLYIAMWNWADDAGRGTCNLRELQAFAFPFDEAEEVGSSDGFRRSLAEVRDHFDVIFYEVAGRRYFAIPSWKRHQRNERTAASRYPEPDDGEPWDFMPPDQRSDGSSDIFRRRVAETRGDSAEAPETSVPGTGEQGNRGTGDKDSSSPASRPRETESEPETEEVSEGIPGLPPVASLPKRPEPGSDEDPDWVKFWSIYPIKDGKSDARKAWAKAVTVKKIPAATILAGAESYRDRVTRERREKKHIKHASGWLNSERWTDENTGATQEAPSGYQPYRNPDDPSGYGEKL